MKSSVLVEVDGQFVTVSNKMLDRISVCQPRELSIAEGDRLHLKANRKLASGGRVTNGELVTVKSVRADGGIELTDGRVLDDNFREFLPGYAVTSYGSQGKTVDYVLFSDSTDQGRDQRPAMVCDDLARAAWHPHLHAGQGATARECDPLRSPAVGDGIRGRFHRSSRRPPLGSVARLSASFRSSRRRQLLSAEAGSSSSASTHTKT